MATKKKATKKTVPDAETWDSAAAKAAADAKAAAAAAAQSTT